MAKRIQRKFFQYTQMKKLRIYLKGLRRIQRLVRARIDRKRYLAAKTKIVRIQRFIRNYLARKNLSASIKRLRIMCQATTKISATRRMIVKRRLFLKQRKAIEVIGRNAKVFLAKARLRKRRFIKKLVLEVCFPKEFIENIASFYQQIVGRAWSMLWDTKIVSSALLIQRVFKGIACRKEHKEIVARAHEAKFP